MSYLVLDVLFGAVALVVLLAALVTLRKSVPTGTPLPGTARGRVPETEPGAVQEAEPRATAGTVSGTLAAVAVTAVVLVILTAVFDNVMIGIGLFDYAGAALLGVHVGLAPLEDFAYPLGAALLLPGLWLLLPGRRRKGRR